MTEEEIALHTLASEKYCPSCEQWTPRFDHDYEWGFVCWTCYETLTDAEFEEFRKRTRFEKRTQFIKPA